LHFLARILAWGHFGCLNTNGFGEAKAGSAQIRTGGLDTARADDISGNHS
jgi:hypothetical protein